MDMDVTKVIESVVFEFINLRLVTPRLVSNRIVAESYTHKRGSAVSCELHLLNGVTVGGIGIRRGTGGRGCFVASREARRDARAKVWLLESAAMMFIQTGGVEAVRDLWMFCRSVLDEVIEHGEHMLNRYTQVDTIPITDATDMGRYYVYMQAIFYIREYISSLRREEKIKGNIDESLIL
jgi:hypothetical protein